MTAYQAWLGKSLPELVRRRLPTRRVCCHPRAPVLRRSAALRSLNVFLSARCFKRMERVQKDHIEGRCLPKTKDFCGIWRVSFASRFFSEAESTNWYGLIIQMRTKLIWHVKAPQQIQETITKHKKAYRPQTPPLCPGWSSVMRWDNGQSLVAQGAWIKN